MDRQPEALSDQLDQLWSGKRRVTRSSVLQCGHNLGTELVRPSWTAALRQQAWKARLAYGRPGLIKGWPGETEGRRGGADGLAVMVHSAQHLVFDLDDVPGIEEW
jgi:hypothetical protein